ncbi:MAG: M28 family peptidase [Candidatus Cloacimonetes bacterium]|nr:M28 family peptidase [Candidatus Cloacimonadota bacterium]
MTKLILVLSVYLIFISCTNSETPRFDQEKAFSFLEEQCEIGPRNPGSEEIKLCREYISSQLENFNADISYQEFQVEISGVEYQGVNIAAGFYPRMSRRILLGAHYDTRPWADKDPDPENHYKPIIGANDAASGVAVLLEIARHLSLQAPAQFGVDLIFFDLEDMGSYGTNDTWCLGSRYYADHYSDALPEKAIIVDMVGDKKQQLKMEYYSYHNSPALVNEVWDTGRNLGYKNFRHVIENMIFDDHVPLIRAGFNAIVIIDFDYDYWHTLEDTVDKCSSESLFVVGQTLLEIIYGKE